MPLSEELQIAIAQLTGWEVKQTTAGMETGGADCFLRQDFRFPNFAEAVQFINRVADAAEAMNHHPDMSIHYNQVTITLWTHDAQSVTELDIQLAQRISELYRADQP